jgi:hypothetical protein
MNELVTLEVPRKSDVKLLGHVHISQIYSCPPAESPCELGSLLLTSEHPKPSGHTHSSSCTFMQEPAQV